ncbi:MAG: ATP-binding protein, partial [Caldilineae bacterium]
AGGEVRLSARVVDHTCEIRVEDTGPGIPEEDLPHIFERFYRVDKSRSRRAARNGQSSGAGLGLSIVQTLVERNGGRISAESAIGKGTTFIVELPLAE